MDTLIRKGDFINLINIDLKELEMNIQYKEIEKKSKSVWNNMRNQSTEKSGFEKFSKNLEFSN